MPDRPKSDPRQFIQAPPVLHVADVRRTAEHDQDVLAFTLVFGQDDESAASGPLTSDL